LTSFEWPPIGGSGGGVPIYSTFSAFPVSATTGSLAVAADTGNVFEFNGTSFVQVAGPGGIFGLGAFDANAPAATGDSLVGGLLSMQSATAAFPGLVNTAAQTFGGNKTFSGTLVASNLSGTNTGDVTLGTADGLSLAGQVLSLALSSASTTGALSSSDWNTFNGKQAAGSYITALTGDGAASGPGSVPFTLATVNANVGSFGSSTSVASFTVNGKGLITAASNTAIQITEAQVTNLTTDLAAKLTNPMTTLGDMIYENATPAPARLAGNTTAVKNFLTQTGTGSVSAPPVWGTIAAGDVPTLNQNTTGTAAGNTTITPVNHATVVSSATNVLNTTGPGTSGQVLTSNGASADPTYQTPSTFTPVAPTAQTFLSGSGTYTRPTSPTPLYIRVRAAGGGGGGAGGGTVLGTSGSAGGNTTFGTSLISCTGGGGGIFNDGVGGTGGTASLGSGPIGIALSGGNGGGGAGTSVNADIPSGHGGNTAFGGAGMSNNSAGTSGATNTGSGGGGGSTGGLGVNSGGGGAAGGFVDALITSPAATYTYAVGAAGTFGNGGTSGGNGGSGGSGVIIVEEFYQ
jgi:hypothetical protein